MTTQSYKYSQPFELESGYVFPELEIGYHTYGELNEKGDNVVWVCHALTANSDVLDWWKGLFGEGEYFDPAKHFIVCANVLGSAYGTTNPLSVNPATGQPYYLTFPNITIRDMVKAHGLIAQHLNIKSIEVLIGGSLGGAQAVEWSIIDPDFIKNNILIATSARNSTWGIAFNESQRLAITADETYYNGTDEAGQKGLKAARSIALLSYRGYKTYEISQKEESDDVVDNFRASSYQSYQGDKLVKRFNAYSYWHITKSMDSHNVGRHRGGVDKALSSIKTNTLVVGIKSDLLFPIEEQQFLSKHIPNATYAEFDSYYGHDGFLIETEILTQIITDFLSTDTKQKVIQSEQIA